MKMTSRILREYAELLNEDVADDAGYTLVLNTDLPNIEGEPSRKFPEGHFLPKGDYANTKWRQSLASAAIYSSPKTPLQIKQDIEQGYGKEGIVSLIKVYLTYEVVD
jgi:hypothetical protein